MSLNQSITFPALKITQPIGEFFIGVMSSTDLVAISYADVRQIENELDRYLGIQRRLNPKRVQELQKYVTTIDATFPTSIILAVPSECADWDEEKSTITLNSTSNIAYNEIAKILDGQHRIDGLKEYNKPNFEINVSIFLDADIAEQANIFATVNLAQTKVNKSLVYDLYDYAQSRSPQKTAHDIAVALDQHEKSPFFHRIKRLGLATAGRNKEQETLTQATVVEALIKLISIDPMGDRDLLLRNKKLPNPSQSELTKLPFRELFINSKDLDITKIILAYFSAVRDKWPKAWEGCEKGQILPKTNGFKALMRFFLHAYLFLTKDKKIGSLVSTEEFIALLKTNPLTDSDFNTNNFKPGSSGEGELYRRLKDGSSIFPKQLSL